MVGFWLPGYVNSQLAIFMSGLPLDLTPSRKPGCGNDIFDFDALKEKNDMASGCFSTYDDRLPLCALSLRSWMRRMLEHTVSRNLVSCDTMTEVTDVSEAK